MNLVKKILATAGLGLALSLNSCSDLQDKKYETLFVELNPQKESLSVGYCDDGSGWENERYDYYVPAERSFENNGVVSGIGLLICAKRDKNEDRIFGPDECIVPNERFRYISFNIDPGRLVLSMMSREGEEKIRYYYIQKGEINLERLKNGILAEEFILGAIQIGRDGEFNNNGFILDRIGMTETSTNFYAPFSNTNKEEKSAEDSNEVKI